eukprot:1618211-Karenia_brevis.AAC.1
MEKYSGEVSGFRMWTFNFVVALGHVDSKLSDEVRKLIGRDDLNGLPTGACCCSLGKVLC